MKHVRFTVPGTHESHVWVSLLGDCDTAMVNGRVVTVPKCCINCGQTDKFGPAEVECTAIGKVWPRPKEQP